MTTAKRFNFVGGYLYDEDKAIGHIEDVQFRQDFEDLLNHLHEEKQRLSKDRQLAETQVMRIRQTVDDMIELERTELGKNVLKQLRDRI